MGYSVNPCLKIQTNAKITGLWGDVSYILRVQMLVAWSLCGVNDKKDILCMFSADVTSLKYTLTCNGLNPHMYNPANMNGRVPMKRLIPPSNMEMH